MATQSMHNRIYIILLNWNGWEDTIDCIRSICNAPFDDYRIVIVDNHSTDNSIVEISSWVQENHALTLLQIAVEDGHIAAHPAEHSHVYDHRSIVLLENSQNSGFAKGNNIGLDYALQQTDCGYCFILNNDTVVPPGMLNALYNVMEKFSDIAACMPAIYYASDPKKLWHAGGRLTSLLKSENYSQQDLETFADLYPITFISGCATLIRKEWLDVLGPLDERFFLGEEDYALSLELLRRKARIVGVKNARLLHKVGSSRPDPKGISGLTQVHRYYAQKLVLSRELTFPYRQLSSVARMIKLISALRNQFGLGVSGIKTVIHQVRQDVAHEQAIDDARIEALKDYYAEHLGTIKGDINYYAKYH